MFNSKTNNTNCYLILNVINRKLDKTVNLEKKYFFNRNEDTMELVHEWDGKLIKVWFQHFEHENMNLDVRVDGEQLMFMCGKVYNDHGFTYLVALAEGEFIQIQSHSD